MSAGGDRALLRGRLPAAGERVPRTADRRPHCRGRAGGLRRRAGRPARAVSWAAAAAGDFSTWAGRPAIAARPCAAVSAWTPPSSTRSAGAARARAGARPRDGRGHDRGPSTPAAAVRPRAPLSDVDHLLDVAGALRTHARLADRRRHPLRRHRRLPRRVSAQLVGRGRDEDRPSVLLHRVDDGRVPAPARLRRRRARTTRPITCIAATSARPGAVVPRRCRRNATCGTCCAKSDSCRTRPA